ncbi:SUN domain-containing protein 2,SUN domain-containing ossification factor [Mytilus edulis]|uniref:SUN domain-containing protein 2,SUN domain-containing ossification factor n=1 Tax=Mytilus edulis TaxID=6550 RepID=A0A8S3U0Q3_MYTED|nr:SUN domain-containing protein 2,SUN domain-containing ossification factor [Mytilus edulis]
MGQSDLMEKLMRRTYGNGNEKLTIGTIQDESTKQIPVDPGGQSQEKLPPEIEVEQNDEKKIEVQTEKQETQTKEKQDNVEQPRPQVEPFTIQTEKQENQDSTDTIAEKKETENPPVKPFNNEDKNVEIPETLPTANISLEQTPDTGKDVSQQLENKGDEIQTFTEWTQKVLEEEKQKTSTEATGSSVSKSKRSVNYASKECGAKVLASNPEAENIKAVLTSNMDEYMINPCKVAKKWFVIELCEPIHVNNFEVASFELFSSQPKTFRVSLSDRYPSKEWTKIGDFTASEERKSHPFPVKDGYVVQFVKVEMLDHYGTEHFCPLTWFRMFGMPVEYDEYGHQPHEDNDDNENDMDEVLLRNEQTEDAESTKNLFASATESVMKLVKKVLNVADKEQDSEKVNQTGSITDDSLIVPGSNTTQNNMTADGYMLPCVPDKKEMETEKKKFDEPLQPSPPYPQSGFVTSPSEPEDVKKKDDESFVTKLEDHEQVPSVSDNLVTLLQNDEEEETVSCDYITDKLSAASYYRKPICKYYDIMKYSQKLPICSLNESLAKEQEEVENRKTLLNKNDFIIKEMAPETQDVSQTEIRPSASEKSPESNQQNVEETLNATSTDVKLSTEKLTESTTSIESMDQTMQSSASINPTSSLTNVEPTKIVTEKSLEETEVLKSLEVSSPDVSQTIQSSSSTESIEVKVSDTTPSLSEEEPKKTVDFVLVDTASSDSSSKPVEQTTETKVLQPEVPSAEESSKIDPSISVEIQQTPILKANASETEGPSTDTIEPVVVGDNVPAYQNAKDLRLIHVPVLPYQKRETAIMRLNNRIKALEMNVSLSSRFLEEMSQKFKKQTEDMIKQHVFNKTVGEITNVTKAIEIQSLIQKQKIDVLETTVQNLTELVIRFTENMENLNQQVQDREFRYIVTVIILCVIVLILMKKKSTKVPREIQEMGTTSNLKHIRRRNSFSGCDHDKVDSIGPAIQKYNSESTLLNSGNYSSDIDPGGTSVHHLHAKKRKRKKQKINGSSTSLTGEMKVTHNKTGINSAGLLFGTSSRESSPEEGEQTKTKSLNRSSSSAGLWSYFASDKQEQLKPKGPDKKMSISSHTGHDKKDLYNSHAKTNGCIPKKTIKTGTICNPTKTSNGCARGLRSGSFNGSDTHYDDFLSLSEESVNRGDIFIVSPFKKKFTFPKGSAPNSHKDSMLKNQTGKQGRSSHTRAGSTDLTYRSVSFKEMNGHN